MSGSDLDIVVYPPVPPTSIPFRYPRAFAVGCVTFGLLSGVVTVNEASMLPPAKCGPAQVEVAAGQARVYDVGRAWNRVLEGRQPTVADTVARMAPNVSVADIAAWNPQLRATGRVPLSRTGNLCVTVRAPKTEPVAYTVTTPKAPGLKGKYSAAELAVIAYRAGWRGRDLTVAVAVALAESGGVRVARCYNTGHSCGATPETAVSVDRGLWQINDRAHPSFPDPDADVPELNAGYAHKLWASQGWRPWSSHNSGSYRKRMPAALAATKGLGGK